MLLTLAVGLLTLAPRPAYADQVFGDLDRDGVGDLVSHDGAWTSVIKVWLSTAPSARFVHSQQPLIWVRVIDVDGDGRPELVGSDRSMRVHVWRYRGGRLRPAKVPHAPRRVAHDTRTSEDQSDNDDEPPPSGGPDPSPCDAPSSQSAGLLVSLTSLPPDTCLVALSQAASRPPSRAPPALS